jgi:hypothetical protein
MRKSVDELPLSEEGKRAIKPALDAVGEGEDGERWTDIILGIAYMCYAEGFIDGRDPNKRFPDKT